MIQPHSPVRSRTHSGPAVLPSSHIRVGAPNPGPHSSAVQFVGHSVMIQPHSPVRSRTHSGPAVLPSSHIRVGAPSPGPHSSAVHAMGHTRSVHDQSLSKQVQVLQPSSASRMSPSRHMAGGHAINVQAHSPFRQVQVLQPSSASQVSPSWHTAPTLQVSPMHSHIGGAVSSGGHA